MSEQEARPSIAAGAPEPETLCAYCWRPVSDHASLFDCILWKRNLPPGGVLYVLQPYCQCALTFPG